MTKLPYDYSRCVGADIPLCGTCKRTQPGRPDGWQSFFVAAPVSETECSEYIPEDPNEPDR